MTCFCLLTMVIHRCKLWQRNYKYLEDLNLPASNYKVPLFYQKILSHELTLKRPAHELRKLNQTLASSTVDLNPHQIDATLFAFHCPLSRGAIFCDG